MNNAAQKVTRIDKDAWEIATELANEYGVSICHIISESVRYCAENAEFKEMDVVVKRLVVGSKVLEQERKMNEEEIIELLKFLMTDYGRGYLAGVVNGMSILLKVLKKEEKEQRGEER